MKQTLTLFTFFLTFFAFNQKNFSLLSSQGETIDISFKSKPEKFIYTKIENQIYVDFSKMYKIVSLTHGAPALPSFGESFVIPSIGNSVLEIVSSSFVEIENVQVLPSKGNLTRNIDPSTIPYTFGEVYFKNEFFPSNPVELGKPFILRTVRGQVARVSPYQYNPVTKVLRVYSSIRFKIINKSNEKGINELLNTKANPSDLKSSEKLFLNSSIDKYDVIEEDGEMLVISPDEYFSTVQPLVNWKNKKGILSTLVSTTVTGTTETSIKGYIQNFYAEKPNLKYILLVGDADKIPAYSYGKASNEELYSDSYYGQLVGDDLYPEVFVGRLSGTQIDLEVMVNRTLEYETDPKSGAWMKKAIGIASSQGAGIGDEDQTDWQHIRGIRNQLLDFGYQEVYEFYDGTRDGADSIGNPTTYAIMNAINEGVGLINYTGHGNLSTFITGNVRSTNIQQATNNGMYPFVVSVACNNGTFVDANCLGEAWLKAQLNSSPTGAIAFCGSSILMDWAPPMQTQDELTLIHTLAYQDNQKKTLGGLFYNAQMSMLEQYAAAGDKVMQTWVFFGDPSTEMNYDNFQDLLVNHANEINANADSILLFTSLVEGAELVLSVENSIIAKGNVLNGQCEILIPAQSSNTLIEVVATKQNYKPYTGKINVQGSSDIIIYPNPLSESLHLFNTKQLNNFTIEIMDLSGKIIDTKEFNNIASVEFPTDHLNSGMYQLLIHSNGEVNMKRFVKVTP